MSVRLDLALLTIAAALGAGATPARADQVDPRLDLLFKELRSGDAVDAADNIARINEIWADSASDTVDILYARAEESVGEGEYALAQQLLTHAVGLSPHFAQGYALRGATRLNLNDREGAMADFSRALELEPRHFDVRSAIAGILYAAGEKRAAYEMYQKVLEWNPHDGSAQRRSRALRAELEGQEI